MVPDRRAGVVGGRLAGPLARVKRMVSVDRPSLLIASRLAASALNFASVPIVARAIGPDGRGVTATVVAAGYIIPIVVAVGVPTELRRRAATADFHESVRTSRLWALLTVVPSLLLALVLGELLFSSLPDGPRMAAIVCLIAAPLTVSWMCDNSVLVATGRFRALVMLQLAQPASFALTVLVLWATRTATVTSVLWANLGGTLLTFLLGILLNRVPLRGKAASLRDLQRQSVRYAGSAVAEAASNRLDQVLILPLIGAFEAGIYSVAVTISSLPIALGYAFGAAYFPVMARAHEAAEARTVSAIAIRQSLVVTLLSIGLASAFVPLAIPWVFGPSFAPAILPTLISLVGSVAMVVGFVATQLLSAEGRGGTMTTVQVVALGVAIGSLVILGPLWGAVGASVASALGFTLVALLTVRALGVPPASLRPTIRALRGGLAVLRSGPSEVRTV